MNERMTNDERTSGAGITEELRERIAAMCKVSGLSGERLYAIADRIDAEHAVKVERLEQYRAAVDAMLKEYVKLPVDADGVPIHVGDELEDGEVARLLICDDAEENSVYVYESPHVIKQIYCYEVVHRKPDSWECIIADALKFAGNGGVPVGARFADYTEEFVERCRRLAGEGA